MKLSKILLLSTTCLLLLNLTLSAQQPYLPKFKQGDPLWQHVLVNPLFQNHPDKKFNLNPYTSINTQLKTELVIDSFLISVVPTLSDLVFLDGLIVQKININTGEIAWEDIIYDATIDSIGWVSYPKIIYKRSDGNIEFCGSRKIINDNIQIFDYSYRAVYDFETGQRTLYYDKSNKATYPDKIGSTNGTYYRLIEDSLYLKSYLYLTGGENPERGLSFCLVNAAHDSIRYLKTIIMDPQVPVHRFIFKKIEAVEVNDSIYAVLQSLEAPPGLSYPGKNMLYLFNIKDINNIHLVNSIDITEYAIFDYRFSIVTTGIFFKEFDGKLFIIDTYYDVIERKQFNFFVLMDDTGKVLDHEDKIKTTDGTFYLEYIPIYLSDTLKLFWANKSKNTDREQSFDLVKMNENNEMEYIASFFAIGDNEEYFYPFHTLWIDNKLIITGIHSLGLSADENNQARYTNLILAYDLEDLKKGSTTVSTSDHITTGLQQVVYPNPTTGLVTIDHLDTPTRVDIYDIKGNLVQSHDNVTSEINISNLRSGLYILKIKNNQINERHKIIKIE